MEDTSHHFSQRNREEIIIDLKELIKSKGYFYVLCMILFEDFHMNPENMHEINYWERLSTKEISLLLGFFIQREIDYSKPDTPLELIPMKQRTYTLMRELHDSFMKPFFEKLKRSLEGEHQLEDLRKEEKEFFGTGEMLMEPIFYSGSGVYDFQYSEFLERKYKYDIQWLIEKKQFDIKETQDIVKHVKNILQEKSKKVHLLHLKERMPSIIEELKKKHPDENVEATMKEIIPKYELYQYVKLFSDKSSNKELDNLDKIGEEGWNYFYKNLIDLFLIRKIDFKKKYNIEAFLGNFSITPKEGLNSQFQKIGDYNIINSHPIIKLDEENYFITMPYLLFIAIYESPFYWMCLDKEYFKIASKNRGTVGEEIAYEFLRKVFGDKRTFKSVKVQSLKSEFATKERIDVTDIDVLCLLGSKALCVQIKSKKLTELSKSGNDEQLKKDFQGAVQDAYEQGLISRKKILEKNAKFMDETGREILLSEDLNEVYIMGITTENYPSLTHQVHTLLDKNNEDPFPIFSTIFDLELITHYLNDPYDFLYYIKQRTSLMEYFIADEEMVFLGYHLDQKLWKSPKATMMNIGNDFGQLIDRNYYPYKAGIAVSDEGDAIENRWKDVKFEKLCEELKEFNRAKITDILFYLFDLSGDARSNLVKQIILTKRKTLNDMRYHNFSVFPESDYSLSVGITYYSLNSDNFEELEKRMISLCQLRKYKNKGDIWIGLGSILSSKRMIDAVFFDEEPWKYDEKLEELSQKLLGKNDQKKYIRFGRKIGRNEKCPCGSGLKYKNCCGKKT